MASTTSHAADKGRRIVGTHRQGLGDELGRRYTNGESIRDLAAASGRSYGFVHRLLGEFGVDMRGRGKPRRRNQVPAP